MVLVTARTIRGRSVAFATRVGPMLLLIPIPQGAARILKASYWRFDMTCLIQVVIGRVALRSRRRLCVRHCPWALAIVIPSVVLALPTVVVTFTCSLAAATAAIVKMGSQLSFSVREHKIERLAHAAHAIVARAVSPSSLSLCLPLRSTCFCSRPACA